MTERDQPPTSAASPTPGKSLGIGIPAEAHPGEPRESGGESVTDRSSQTSSSGQLTQDTQALAADVRHEDLARLFESQQTKELQQRWHDIQAAFVDDPHDAIRQAGALNDEIVSALTTALDDRKHTLERGIADGDTEQLRMGMRQYHQMLDQILTL